MIMEELLYFGNNRGDGVVGGEKGEGGGGGEEGEREFS